MRLGGRLDAHALIFVFVCRVRFTTYGSHGDCADGTLNEHTSSANLEGFARRVEQKLR
jgi:hypothetical protein